MKILKQLQSLLSMMGVYQYLSSQQIRQATIPAYMLTGQSPRQATFQSNQAGLQIIFLDTYRYSETNLPPHTCRHGQGL